MTNENVQWDMLKKYCEAVECRMELEPIYNGIHIKFYFGEGAPLCSYRWQDNIAIEDAAYEALRKLHETVVTVINKTGHGRARLDRLKRHDND